ncbi:MAG: hypothetical protein SGI92_16285 [Bryobacteraceae bacterium]|nr:hypothetical protein [Bryobacteraceae bacterium]
MRFAEVREKIYRRRRFTTPYTRADKELLAMVDEAHETLSGAATRKIPEWEFSEYGKTGFERLAEISVSHLYRFRQSKTYRQRRVHFTKTRPAKVSIQGAPPRQVLADLNGGFRLDAVTTLLCLGGSRRRS